MKIISYNIRGLGKRMKRKEVRDLVAEFRADFCCIQETKLEVMEDRVCRATWGNSEVDWVYKASEGRSGGMLSIWNAAIFCKSSSWFMRGALIVNGVLIKDGTRCCIVNVYAPCVEQEQNELWQALQVLVEQNQDVCVCIVGDFNTIRFREERVGRSRSFDPRETEKFEDFITQSNLFDVPLRGRFFTWYRPDGTCKSKLDRALINEEWIEKWPGVMLKGIDRSTSDHCPILMHNNSKDWGPRPFRFLNVWTTHPNFLPFVEDKWRSYKVEG